MKFVLAVALAMSTLGCASSPRSNTPVVVSAPVPSEEDQRIAELSTNSLYVECKDVVNDPGGMRATIEKHGADKVNLCVEVYFKTEERISAIERQKLASEMVSLEQAREAREAAQRDQDRWRATWGAIAVGMQAASSRPQPQAAAAVQPAPVIRYQEPVRMKCKQDALRSDRLDCEQQ